MSREDSTYNLSPLKVVVGPGATLAVKVTQIDTQVSTQIRYGSGGSLEIVPVPNMATFLGATTWAAASLVPFLGNGFLMGTDTLKFSGPAQFYLLATGATTTAYIIKEIGQFSVNIPAS